MGTLISIILMFLVIFFILPNLGSQSTKLFRRIWSTERAGMIDDHTRNAREQAITALAARYGLKATDDQETLRKAAKALIADALAFDMKHPQNSGIEVTPIVAQEIRKRFPAISD